MQPPKRRLEGSPAPEAAEPIVPRRNAQAPFVKLLIGKADDGGVGAMMIPQLYDILRTRDTGRKVEKRVDSIGSVGAAADQAMLFEQYSVLFGRYGRNVGKLLRIANDHCPPGAKEQG